MLDLIFTYSANWWARYNCKGAQMISGLLINLLKFRQNPGHRILKTGYCIIWMGANRRTLDLDN